MVDAIVSYAVGRLGDFLTQEAVILQGIEGEVQWLQTELRFMRSYLKDADQKQGSNERIRTWISVLQDIAYDTEDVIESFMLNDNNTNEPIHSSKQGMIGSYIRKRTCKKAKHYDIGKDIEDLKKRVLEITRLRQTYGIDDLGIIQNNMTSGGDGSRITTPYDDEGLDVVGFEDDFQHLRSKLFNDTQSRSIISILGMGGLGKTTIARKLYNNKKIMFTKHAWICVSQEWNAVDLFRKLIKSFVELSNEEREKVDKMDLPELVRYLRNLLQKCRYLVVIDDLWHREAWESIKKAFPENKNGSRIIITTRKEDVAELQDHTTLVHKLRFLREEESWSLFCNKAFPGNNGVFPNDLEKLGKEMTAKCGGLPLAIIVLGGLLSRKESHEWLEVKEHIWREVKEDSINDISPLLDLSYNDLPINLKSCFLYLGIFPEDASIKVEQLVKLWVAEGFIPINEEGNRTLEEVSEYYFKELLGRNLVQTVRRNWRMTSFCRVHDLVRDLAIKKARETNFLCVHNQIGSSSSLRTTSCRRFAIQSGSAHEEFLNHLHKKARPLMARALEKGNYEELVDPRLEHNYNPQEMACMVACAAASIRHSARRRSKMSQLYGDIQTLYIAYKHRGFVIISYYDLRAACNAMRALQNKPLRHKILDIHFSIPKNNLTEKDINQGNLVVFNLDSSISNDEIYKIFGIYGDIKEILETSHRSNHKFIEFYDSRSAEAALRALNRTNVAGKRIEVETTHTGGEKKQWYIRILY